MSSPGEELIVKLDLRCCHRKHEGEVWTLVLQNDYAEVLDEEGEVRAKYERGDTPEHLLLPSFSESIKQFRAQIDGEMWYFDAAKRDLAEIKTYLDESVVAAGPEAVRAIRNRALRDLLIGIAAVVVGIGVTVASYLAAENAEDGRFYVTYGAVIFGLVMVGKGIWGFVQHGKLQKMLQEREEEEDS
jgi:hypothetical protein